MSELKDSLNNLTSATSATSNSRPRSLTEGLIEAELILPDHPQSSSTTSSTTMSPHSFCQGLNLGSTLVHTLPSPTLPYPTLPSPTLSRTTSGDSYPYRKLGSQTLHIKFLSKSECTFDFGDQFLLPSAPPVAKRIRLDLFSNSSAVGEIPLTRTRSDESHVSDRSYFSIDLTEIISKMPGSHGKGKTPPTEK
jgi:hypothetical protein